MTVPPNSRESTISPLAQSVSLLKGVGPERTTQLSRLGIRTIEELLLQRPRRYEDRRHFRRIAELAPEEAALTHGKVVAQGVKWFKQHTRSVFELILEDGTARLHCRWWNLPFMENYFTIGDEVVVFGKLVAQKPRTIDHPETEVVVSGEESFIHLNRITPIYPLTEGLPQRWMRALVWRTLRAFEGKIKEPWLRLAETENTGPAPRRDGKAGRVTSLPSRAQAIQQVHFPEELDQIEKGRRRLALDEFIALQCEMRSRRKNLQTKAVAMPCGGDNRFIKPFLTRLQFKLTEAQTRVLRQMRKDLSGPHPMRRLLQGDVGSGKTVVAACCALMALESGHDVALMAPTEILAEQHYQTFSRWIDSLGIEVRLQTGSHKSVPQAVRNGNDERQSLKSSDTRQLSKPVLFIGTHALIEAGFAPDNLGLVIIDEQHKFGVAQREKLLRKGKYPHLLVMTATPIPRTLGLTLYGDLDISTIDQAPPGRRNVQTFIRTATALPKVWEFVRAQLKQGRQAYVVYPRVEEANGGVKAVSKEYENLSRELAPFRVGMVHGRVGPREKEAVMSDFRSGNIQVLLATSVIEVGLDVPNATVMLIENAEQFGLAQLHQLRGRIGRGAHDSYCILVSVAGSAAAKQRLSVLEETNDGFRIAEADLKLRGLGELLGQEQSGTPRFRFGDLTNDMALIEMARDFASRLV